MNVKFYQSSLFALCCVISQNLTAQIVEVELPRYSPKYVITLGGAPTSTNEARYHYKNMKVRLVADPSSSTEYRKPQSLCEFSTSLVLMLPDGFRDILFNKYDQIETRGYLYEDRDVSERVGDLSQFVEDVLGLREQGSDIPSYDDDPIANLALLIKASEECRR